MRQTVRKQSRLDCPSIADVKLNLECRDEIIPILRALQFIYSDGELCESILELIAQDVNKESCPDRGRKGMDYWHILVLAAVRMGCNYDYDKLQDLAEQHRNLRYIMGIGDWEEETVFDWRRIRNNICHLKPSTIEKISHLIVDAGHEIVPDAVKKMRADSFVVETNIHYPTESSLMLDGIRVILRLCLQLAIIFDLQGWRQQQHLLKKAKKLQRSINRISKNKGGKYKERLAEKYRELIKLTDKILERAEELLENLRLFQPDSFVLAQMVDVQTFIERTRQVRNTAERRVLKGETVPNEDKLFSIFEPHTQLYKRGKAGEPQQFGRLVMIYEDGAGFITHHYLLPRDAQDSDVVVGQTRQLQERLGGGIESASFDRGFHSPENQTELATIITHPCLPTKGTTKSREQQKDATIEFREARQRHPGIESAIGALQSGNGLKRCRDRTKPGFERYIALGILGRNLHTLGKLVITQEDTECHAAESRRKHAA